MHASQNPYHLVEGPRSTDWIAPGVIKHHRTISTYLTAMLESGFTIRTIDEWCPSPGQLAQNPEWSNELHRPTFLLVGATR